MGAQGTPWRQGNQDSQGRGRKGLSARVGFQWVLRPCISKQAVAAVGALTNRIKDKVNCLIMAGGGHVAENLVRAAATGVNWSVHVGTTKKAQRGGSEAHLVKAGLATVGPVAELDCELKRAAGDKTAGP